MMRDPIEIAVRHIVESRDLLENLITSSESFDYYNAKEALERLQRKIRQLARLQLELDASRGEPQENVSMVQFREQELWQGA